MNHSGLRLLALVLSVALLAVGCAPAPSEPASDRATRSPAPARAAAPPAAAPETSRGVLQIVDDAAIKNYGKVIYRGSVDLSATIERIRGGGKHPHRNDGSVFGNRERLLPKQKRGYYREYVHPTHGIGGPGPQRIVVGQGGDWWYTPDHYASFVPLGRETR